MCVEYFKNLTWEYQEIKKIRKRPGRIRIAKVYRGIINSNITHNGKANVFVKLALQNLDKLKLGF